MLKKESMANIGTLPNGGVVKIRTNENPYEFPHVHIFYGGSTVQVSINKGLDGKRTVKGVLTDKQLKAVNSWLDDPKNHKMAMDWWHKVLDNSGYKRK